MDVPVDPSRPHPFAHDVDPDAFYPSSIHESVRAGLVAAAKTHTGFVILAGEPGTGKTAVLHQAARDLEHGGVRVLRSSALRPPHEMFSPAGGGPGPAGAAPPATWGASFLTTLRDRVRAEGATVVAVDDAQRLTLTELRFFHDLADAERATGRRLAILLVGPPGFDVTLARLEDDRADAAVVLRIRLSPLDTSDVCAYMAYRLQRSGLRLDDVFETDAVDRVVAHAQGLPRMINQLCYAALHTATEAGLATVSASSVEAAAGWLELDLPRPAGSTRERRAGKWARRLASTGAVLGAGARVIEAVLAATERSVGRAARTGVRGIASAGAMLGAWAASIGAALVATGRRVGHGVRAGVSGIASIGALLARSTGAALVAAVRSVGRGVRTIAHGVASAGTMVTAAARNVGAALVATGGSFGHGVRAGGRGIASAGALLDARVRSVGKSLAVAGRNIDRGIVSAGALLGTAVRNVGGALAAAGRSVGHGARTGVHGAVSAGTQLGTAVRNVGGALAAAGRGVGPGARTRVHGVASAGALLGTAVRNVGGALAAAGRGVGHGVGVGVRGILAGDALLMAAARNVGAVLVATRRNVGGDVRTGLHRIASVGARLGPGAWRAAGSMATAWHATSRRTEAWVTHQAAFIFPKIRTASPGATVAVLGLVVFTLVMALWPMSYEPPTIERPPPFDTRQSLQQPPDPERKPSARAGTRGGTRPQGTSRPPGSAAREPVTFATARPPSDR